MVPTRNKSIRGRLRPPLVLYTLLLRLGGEGLWYVVDLCLSPSSLPHPTKPVGESGSFTRAWASVRAYIYLCILIYYVSIQQQFCSSGTFCITMSCRTEGGAQYNDGARMQRTDRSLFLAAL